MRELLHARLGDAASGLKNDDLLARMIASQRAGDGALPPDLGLGHKAFRQLMARHFPGAFLEGQIIPPVADDRADEREQLSTLLMQHLAGEDASEEWLAQIVVTACMAADHLWQDLGLWSRADLSRLMQENFPTLAAKNTKDMKWKKFLYKQLCEAEGIYTCRSPSCEVCDDYLICFGPEA